MPSKRILILGGTGLARELAADLIGLGHHVISSLAGVTTQPNLPPGLVRQGGFGGVDGLVQFLRIENIELMIDATHAFARGMSDHVVAAGKLTDCPVIRLEQAVWQPGAGDRWTDVSDHAAAVLACPLAARVFLTIGRKMIAPFAARPDLGGVMRMIEEPGSDIGSNWLLVKARPPFSIADEMALMETHRISHLVTKNAGGEGMANKLHAARDLGLEVIMIGRPPKPPALTFGTIQHVLNAI
jgi:precorrin-6A/cobalt-precorrin-6A reductase